MQVLHDKFDIESFYRSLTHAPRRLLMLDYDGTLAAFSVQRNHALPYPGVRETLDKLIANQRNRVVIITGRVVSELLPLLGLHRAIELWGSHGIERRFPSGESQTATLDPEPLRGLMEADAWVKLAGLAPHAENKPGSVALHWRGLPQARAEELRAHALRRWSGLAQQHGCDLRFFDGGLELRVPAPDKGDAVRFLLSEEAEGIPAAYFGDDVTDEDAFRVLEKRGLRVLVRPELRDTAADLWLRPPVELLQFLSRWQESGR